MPELKQLSAPHQKMVELYLQGFKPGEIASQLGYSREGVTWVIGSGPFQNELARRRKNLENVHEQTLASTVVQARSKIAQATELAADRLIEHTASQDERISMMAIKEILDRGCGGTGGSGQVQVNILSPERVALVLQSIRESGRQDAGGLASPNLIDVVGGGASAEVLSSRIPLKESEAA